MWRLRFDSSLVPWASVPRPDEQERRRDWGRVVTGALRRQWEFDETGPFAQALARTIETLLRPQPDDALADLVTWPLRSPLPLRVTFHIVDADASPDWAGMGFEAAPYPQSPFGAGIQYSRRLPRELTGEVTAVDAVIVFDRGDAALLVRLHPCPIDVYVAAASTFADLLASCTLEDSTGRAFTTGGNEYRVPGEADAWPEEGVGVRE